MSGDVIALHGGVPPGQPNPEVVEILRRALASAEAGRVMSLGLITMHPDGAFDVETAGPESLAFLGAVNLLRRGLEDLLVEAGDPAMTE